MKRLFLLAVGCLLTTSLAFAQMQQGQPQQIRAKAKLIHGAPTTCPNDPVMPSNGVVTDSDLIFPQSTAYYTLNAKGGHSYSIEVWAPFDPTTNFAPTIQVGTSCNSNDINPTPVTNVDPDISGGFSARVSWEQASDQTLSVALINPDTVASYSYYISVTDTSLHNIHWSTFSNFDTQWSLANLTSSAITGTLTVVNDKGTTVATIPVMIPANRFTQISAKGSGVHVDQQGAATFVYVGTPGAVRGDTTIIRGDAGVITLSPFVSQHSSY